MTSRDNIEKPMSDRERRFVDGVNDMLQTKDAPITGRLATIPMTDTHKPDISREAVERIERLLREHAAYCKYEYDAKEHEQAARAVRALRDELDKAEESAKEAYDQLLKIDVSSICEHSERDKLYETIFVLEPIAERVTRALKEMSKTL